MVVTLYMYHVKLVLLPCIDRHVVSIETCYTVQLISRAILTFLTLIHIRIDVSARPDHFKFPGLGRGPPPGPTLLFLAQSLLSPVGPGWGLLPGPVLGMGPTHLPTPRREGGRVRLISWTSPSGSGWLSLPSNPSEGRGGERASGDSPGHPPAGCLSHIP